MISKSDKVWLLVRANYRCEYCYKPIQGESYQIEHVFPESRGGLTVETNLAIACERCNRNKGDNIEWIDPFTGIASPIFNPRCMRWEEHFRCCQSPLGMEIIGQSPIGRATASLLFRYTSQYIPGYDLQWDKLENLQQNVQLYQFGNHLRFLRLQNDFGSLHTILTRPLPPIDATESERQTFDFAKAYLLIEVCFTRSRNLSDINQGIAIGQQILERSMLSPIQVRQIQNLMSILYQQRATINYLNGKVAKAKKDQIISYHYYPNKLNLLDKEINYNNPSALLSALRSQSLYTKYATIELSEKTIKHLISVVHDVDTYESSQYFSFLIDLAMSCHSISAKALEVVYEAVTNLLLTHGYGTSIDLAKLITLRRRWWVLHILFGSSVWQDALIGDMKLWRKVLMFNEIRETKCLLQKTQQVIGAEKYKDAEFILRT